MSPQYLRVMCAACSGILALVLACDPRGASDRDTQLTARYQAEGTVGQAGYDYRLSMDAITKWYAVVRPLAQQAERDSTFHLKFDFPTDSSVESQIVVVRAVPLLRDAIARAGLSEREFIAVTAALGGARWYEGRKELFNEIPVNVHPSNLEFIRKHAVEIARLDSTLPG